MLQVEVRESVSEAEACAERIEETAGWPEGLNQMNSDTAAEECPGGGSGS